MPATWATGSRRGFTLVELMVVLAVAALLATSIPLALNRLMPARRTIAAADRLIADVQRLQSEAASSGAVARMRMNGTGYELDIPGQRALATVTLPGSMTLRLRAREEDRPLRELVVYPDGTASPGRFEFADSGRQAVVEIGMLTGRPRRVR
jgi:general secretion pathway protein H